MLINFFFFLSDVYIGSFYSFVFFLSTLSQRFFERRNGGTASKLGKFDFLPGVRLLKFTLQGHRFNENLYHRTRGTLNGRNDYGFASGTSEFAKVCTLIISFIYSCYVSLYGTPGSIMLQVLNVQFLCKLSTLCCFTGRNLPVYDAKISPSCISPPLLPSSSLILRFISDTLYSVLHTFCNLLHLPPNN